MYKTELTSTSLLPGRSGGQMRRGAIRVVLAFAVLVGIGSSVFAQSWNVVSHRSKPIETEKKSKRNARIAFASVLKPVDSAKSKSRYLKGGSAIDVFKANLEFFNKYHAKTGWNIEKYTY